MSPELMAGVAFWVDEHDQDMIAIVDERMRAVGLEHHDRARQGTTFTIHDARRTSMHHELESVVSVRTGRTDRSAVEQPPRSERQMTGPACWRAGHRATVFGLDEVVAVNTVVGVPAVGRGCFVGGYVMIPSAIINPYAVRRIGPIDRVPLAGPGILATIISTPPDYYDGL